MDVLFGTLIALVTEGANSPFYVFFTFAVLAAAFRRALAIAKINGVIREARDEAIEKARATKLPKNLRQQIARKLKEKDSAAWDQVLYDLAESLLTEEDDD